jgi:phenylacetic acid degradation operon negative regulatory protein
MKKQIKNQYSLLDYVLSSFIPFTGPNRDLLYHRGRFMRKISKLTGSSINSINTTIARAQKNGYLEKVEEKGKKGLRLTTKGRMKTLKIALSDKKERWDGCWRIIIFDIPEKKRKTRDAFRKMIADLGFKKYQISVWICPYSRTSELEMIIEELRLRPYIQHFVSKSVTEERKLKKIFELD